MSDEELQESSLLPTKAECATFPPASSKGSGVVRCLVVSRGWPAWYSTALALVGERNVRLWSDSVLACQRLGQEVPVDDGKNWTVLKEWWEEAEIVMVSGSLKFIGELASKGFDLKKAIGTLDLAPRPPQRSMKSVPLKWTSLRHDRCGGATMANCLVGVGSKFAGSLTGLGKDPLKRRIRDYLSSTEAGRTLNLNEGKRRYVSEQEYNSSQLVSPDLIHPGGLLPVDWHDRTIAAPSESSPSGWVQRKLTVSELAQIWDLPVGWQGRLSSQSRTEALEFVNSSPGRVLWKVATRLPMFQSDEMDFGQETAGPPVTANPLARASNSDDHLRVDGASSRQLSKETIRWQEEVMLLESSLEQLGARQETMQASLTEVREKRSRLTETLSELEARRVQLQAAKEQQVALHAALESWLIKVRALLARLITNNDVSVEEMDELIAELNDSLQDDDDKVETPSFLSTSVVELEEGQDEAADDGVENQVQTVRMPITKTVDLDLFWRNQARGHLERRCALLPFLPPSRNLVRMVMDVMAREILALDPQEQTGRHRRESLWKTCDVRTMVLSFKQLNKIERPSNQNDNEEERPPSSSLDPNVALCPHELSGRCLNPYCSYQHLEARPVTRILAREFLPLPPLTFLTTDLSPDQDEGSDPRRLDEVSDSRPKKRPRLGLSPNESSATGSTVHDPGALFIDLDTYSGTLAEVGDTGSDDNTARSITKKVSVWWLPDALTSSASSLSKPFSLHSLLAALGCDFSPDHSELILRVSPDRCSFFGAVVDYMRLATHAGQLDVAASLESIPYQLANEKSAFDCLLLSCWDLLRDVVGRDSFHGSADQSPCRSIFERQLRLALASYLIQLLRCFFSAHDDDDKDSLRLWVEPLLSFEKAFEPDANGTEPVEIPASPFDFYEDGRDASERTVEVERIESLLRRVCRMSALSRAIAEGDMSVSYLIDRILDPLTTATQMALATNLGEMNSPLYSILNVVLTVGFVVLGVLERTAILITIDKADLEVRANSEVEDLYARTDKLLCTVLDAVAEYPWMDVVLSPLFAANFALACSLQLYERAQMRLGKLLDCESVRGDSDLPLGVPLMSYSELLWSQLVQLRASLPLYAPPESVETSSDGQPDENQVTWELPDDIVNCHDAIAARIEMLGISLHHIRLDKDLNIIKALTTRKGKESDLYRCMSTMVQTTLAGGPHDGLSFPLDCHGVSMTRLKKSSSPLKSMLPQSLLLMGTALDALNLHSCNLNRLPSTFGWYMPNLVSLDLSDNKLGELPKSIGLLQSLKVLHMDDNCVSALPSTFGLLHQLETLTAANNRLRELPLSMAEGCHELTTLFLDRNPLEPSVWPLLSCFPKLRNVRPDPASPEKRDPALL